MRGVLSFFIDNMDTEKIFENIGIDGQIAIMRNGLGTVCDGLFHLFYNWHRSKGKNDISESDAIAQCILQIIVCKIRSLLDMSNGINVRPEKDTIRILDIPSLISVLRSLYEMAFVFHNIYAEQETKEERDIVLYIWKIRGLNNRQNMSIVPLAFKEKAENEKKQIEDLKNRIISIVTNLDMSDEIRKQLINVASMKTVEIKGYRFRKDSENNRIMAFEDYRYEEGAEVLLRTDAPTYRFLSIHGHPSYLGVLQFGQLFHSDTDKGFLRTILTCACKLSSTIAIDFREHIDGADDVFSQLNEKEKEIIITLHNS